MQTFKNFLNETYNTDAERILQDYVNYIKTLKNVDPKEETNIEYNSVDKEYYFNFLFKGDEYNIYISRKNMNVFIINLENGKEIEIQSPEELKTVLK